MALQSRVGAVRALGADLGGSSTRVHLLDPIAPPLDRVLPGGNVTIDRMAVLAMLLPLFDEYRPTAACLGLAGARTTPDAATWLADELGRRTERIIVMTDAELAMHAAFGPDADGILVSAGTGTVAVARVNGEVRIVGGSGYLLGDAGGAYDIGRRIVAAALRERDLGASELAAELEPRLGATLDAFVESVYRDPTDRTLLASLAAIVPDLQHPAGREVLDQAAAALVELAERARARFGPLPVRLTGGVFGSERIRDSLRDALGAEPSTERPEVVAARIAAAA